MPILGRYVDGEAELIYAEDYDLAVDVRSPGEFEEDHIVGAINCPVLDNEERRIVGTIYKQVSRAEWVLVSKPLSQRMMLILLASLLSYKVIQNQAPIRLMRRFGRR
jgi:tRNA 2-selenouridine synthase SelU